MGCKELQSQKIKMAQEEKTPTKASEKIDSIYADFEQRGTIF